MSQFMTSRIATTDRLIVRPLVIADAPFLLRLLNEPSWIRFIGDKGVHSLADAEHYIRTGPMEMYRKFGFGLNLVQLKERERPIGVCGLLKRDSLPEPDLGFALLEECAGQGYAFEAASAVMSHAGTALGLRRVLAITTPDNVRSGRLLEKLGFAYDRLIQSPEGEELKLYRWTAPSSADERASERILDLYQRHAADFDRDRGRSLQEKGWLDTLLSYVPPSGTILDVGCGMGEPIARYLIDRGHRVVGIDSSPALIDLCRARFPESEWLVGDMRDLALGRRFDGIVAWDSFFHLTMDDQRAMFVRFATHARPGAPLLFTSGSGAGEAIGSYCDEPLYHASLDATEYEALLADHGFAVVAYVADDSTCGEHTVWLARFLSAEPPDLWEADHSSNRSPGSGTPRRP